MLNGLSLVILKGMPFSRIDWRRKMLIAVDRLSGHYNGGIDESANGGQGRNRNQDGDQRVDRFQCVR